MFLALVDRLSDVAFKMRRAIKIIYLDMEELSEYLTLLYLLTPKSAGVRVISSTQ